MIHSPVRQRYFGAADDCAGGGNAETVPAGVM
jgi:hypothetical protein